MNINQKSMLEVAIELMGQKKKPQNIRNLITEVLEIKGLDDPDGNFAAKLYIDITTSALFVFCGQGEWDLKERHSLDLWDKDGSHFNSGKIDDEDEDDSIDEVTASDYEVEVESEEEEDDDDDDDDDDDVELVIDEPFITYHDDDDVELTADDYIDEDEYNDIMDDYEGLYDDK